MVKHKMSTAYTNGPCSSFLYDQTVSCLLVIAIGGILTKILLNTFVQIKAHGFRISDPEATNAVPLTRHPILARGSTERFQKILAGNRHNALLFAPRLGELKTLRLVALAHTDCKHLRLGLKQGNGADVLSAILIGYHPVYFWSTKASKGRMVTAPSGALPG